MSANVGVCTFSRNKNRCMNAYHRRQIIGSRTYYYIINRHKSRKGLKKKKKEKMGTYEEENLAWLERETWHRDINRNRRGHVSSYNNHILSTSSRSCACWTVSHCMSLIFSPKHIVLLSYNSLLGEFTSNVKQSIPVFGIDKLAEFLRRLEYICIFPMYSFKTRNLIFWCSDKILFCSSN